MAQTLYWTYTDEAPQLATHAFLPIVKAFAKKSNINVDVRRAAPLTTGTPQKQARVTRARRNSHRPVCSPPITHHHTLSSQLADISVAARVISAFPERLTAAQRKPDDLAMLGELAKTPEASIVKLPNVSASIPQLQSCIAELREKGYDVPLYPVEPADDAEKAIKERYGKILGSAVNPVLREGNSDRRVAGPVKKFAQKNPHPMPMSKYDAAGNKVGSMPWTADSKTRVAGMTDGDFFGSELSQRCAEKCEVRIEHVSAGGDVTVLKPSVKLQAGEVIDASRLSAAKLREYIEAELTQAKADGVMVSVHLKATMMKISDPIMFGHFVSVFFKDAFAKHADAFAALGVNPNLGLGSLYEKLKALPDAEREAIEADLAKCYESRPKLAMVDSDKGITKAEILSFAPVAARMEGFDFDVQVRVKSFTMRISKDGSFSDLPSGNNRITPDQQEALKRVRRGNILYLEDILVSMPDGTERDLPPMKLKVTG